MMKYLSFFLTTFAALLLSAWEWDPSIDFLTLSENTTLYSLPGWNWKSYKLAKKSGAFEKYREQGREKEIPKPLAWPKKGEHLFYYGTVKTPKHGKYYYVQYQGHSGYIDVNSAIATSTPSKEKKNVAARFHKTPCDPCHKPENLSGKKKIETMGQILTPFSSSSNPLKSWPELDKYFYRYRWRCQNKPWENYKSQYKPYIKAAAQAFNVPAPFLACLLFKESQWTNRRSTSGALGIAQLLPSTAHYMNGLVEKINNSPEWVAKMEKIVNEYSAHQQGKPLYSKLSPKQLRQKKSDYVYAQTSLYNYSLVQPWKTYIETLTKISAFKAQYKGKPPWRGKHPETFSPTEAEVPVLAIGAAATYLRHIINNFEKELFRSLKTTHHLDANDIDFLTAVAGAYNIGPGNAVDYIIADTEALQSPKKWVEAISAVSNETKKHMLSIKRCMAANIQDPPLQFTKNRKSLINQTACPN